MTITPLSLSGRGSFLIVGPGQMLELFWHQIFINLDTITTYPLAECTGWLVLRTLLRFGGGAPNDKPTEVRDGPGFPNCNDCDGITESLFVSNSFGGPILSPITRLLLVDLLAMFPLTFEWGHVRHQRNYEQMKHNYNPPLSWLSRREA